MPAAFCVVLAVVTILIVAVALMREVLKLRAGRRELDGYLRWLLQEATGPLRVASLRPGR